MYFLAGKHLDQRPGLYLTDVFTNCVPNHQSVLHFSLLDHMNLFSFSSIMRTSPSLSK